MPIDPEAFELDHVIAMDDGGTDDPSNLQAVHPLINRMKGTLGSAQFVELCRAVVECQEGNQ